MAGVPRPTQTQLIPGTACAIDLKIEFWSSFISLHIGHFGHFGNGPGLAVLIELSGLLKLHSQANVTHLQNSFVMVVSIDKELIFSGKPLLPAEI